MGTDDGVANQSRLFYAADLDDISKGYIERKGTPPYQMVGSVNLNKDVKLHLASAYEAYFPRILLARWTLTHNPAYGDDP